MLLDPTVHEVVPVDPNGLCSVNDVLQNHTRGPYSFKPDVSLNVPDVIAGQQTP